MAPENRDVIVRFRAKPSDIERWQSAADARRITLSEWLREAADAVGNMEAAGRDARRPFRRTKR